MKVLWFTNTPSRSAKYINASVLGGGWIESLESEVTKMPDIELGIVFNWSQFNNKSFIVHKTKYFPVKSKGIKGIFKKIFYRWTHNIESNEQLQQYLEIVKEFKPDVIHLFGTETDYGLIIPKITVPCVIHIQGNLIVYGHKWYTGLTAIEILRYSKKLRLMKGHGLFHDFWLNKKMAKREWSIFQGCRYFMGRTDWDKRISSVLSPKSKYFHCDEIMRPKFYSHQWRPNFMRNNYVIVSTIKGNIYKGLETIFECKKILLHAFTEHEILWKIAGISEQNEIAYLVERKFNAKFKDKNIQLFGALQENELIEEMLQSDLFVHSSHIENSPNSVCEAMLLGMPIIATYAGGTPSIIENKKEGLLIQDGDPYALAGAIIELIRDRNYAASLGANARERAMIRHNPEKISNELRIIYESVIES